jgi:hypothetical protein
MDPGNSIPNLEKQSAPSGAVSHAVVRAALWIAYIQLLIVLSVTFIFWTAFRRTASHFSEMRWCSAFSDPPTASNRSTEAR